MKNIYLNDKKFLKALDLEPFKEQYIKITILDFVSELPLVSLEGKCISGSCNLSGASNVRRTASCSIAVDKEGITRYGYSTSEQYYDITEVDNLISINKKVCLEVGFSNTLQEIDIWERYKNYNIIWFPLGVYVIKAGSVSKSNSGINISLTLNDKMSLLNGDVGGVIPAATNFSEEETFNAFGTERTVKKILIKDIIRNLVVEFGGENPENVLISDVPETALKVMKWTGRDPIYYINNKNNKYLTKTKPSTESNYSTFAYGQDIGYVSEPFIYPGDLECGAGETVTSVLDKIKNGLGNYEYYYDLEGRFIFQEIKNFLNSNPVSTLLELDKKDYQMVANFSTSAYNFDAEAAALIMSISSSPQFPNIKNDFLVWGATKMTTGADKPIRYRLAFEDKPNIGINRFALVYTDYRGLQTVLPLNNDNYEYTTEKKFNDHKKYYYYKKDNDTLGSVWHWDEEKQAYRVYSEYEICYLQSADWRTEVFYQGLWAEDSTFAQQPYYAELNSEWTKIINVKGEKIGTKDAFPIYKDTFRSNDTSSYEYWLDFIEDSKFNIKDIGRRTKVISDNSINCLFPVKIENNLYALADGDVSQERKDAEFLRGYDLIQVSESIYNDMVVSGSNSSAYEKIKELIYNYTSYNESINLTIAPIYYLEPNTRITVCDTSVGINGDYLIKTMSLPLAPNGSSSISAAKIIEKSF